MSTTSAKINLLNVEVGLMMKEKSSLSLDLIDQHMETTNTWITKIIHIYLYNYIS